MKRDSRLSGVLHVLLHMAEQRARAFVIGVAFGHDRAARPRRGERLDDRAHGLGRDALAAHARRPR